MEMRSDAAVGAFSIFYESDSESKSHIIVQLTNTQ